MQDGKKGNVVAYKPWVMGRIKSLWGDDREDFHPERWFDENDCFRQETPFEYTAFQVPQNRTTLMGIIKTFRSLASPNRNSFSKM